MHPDEILHAAGVTAESDQFDAHLLDLASKLSAFHGRLMVPKNLAHDLTAMLASRLFPRSGGCGCGDE